MNLSGSRQLPGFPALLAQRMCCHIPVTNSFPCTAIAPPAGRITFMFVVVRRNNLLMFLTIPAICQLGTAGIGTGTLGFVWHSCRLLPVIKKAPADCPARALYFYFRCYCNTIRFARCLSMSFSVLFKIV